MFHIFDSYHCSRIIKKNSRSFHKAFSVLPRAKRNAVFAIYAFCRLCDDAIDLRSDTDELNDIAVKLDKTINDNPPAHPVFRALSRAFKRYNLQAKPFRDMIEGQFMDVRFSQPETQENLENYCYYVAGTVGLMILPIIATINGDALTEQALKLGQAMQITNILRDVGEDYRAGRIYLPKTEMARFGVVETELAGGYGAITISEQFKALWEHEAAIAEKLYDSFLSSVSLFDSDSRPAVLASALYYRAILDAVRQNGHNCLTKRAVVRDLATLRDRVASYLKS